MITYGEIGSFVVTGAVGCGSLAAGLWVVTQMERRHKRRDPDGPAMSEWVGWAAFLGTLFGVGIVATLLTGALIR